MFLSFLEYSDMGGKLDEKSYNDYERKARALINLYTHGRIAEEEPVRTCVLELAYELINLLADEQESMANIHLSSATNDGVSQSYVGVEKIVPHWEQKKRRLIVDYLTGEVVKIGREYVPLLYAGVEYDGGRT